MTRPNLRLAAILLASLSFAGCSGASADTGTSEQREALFESLVTKIMAREAFSPIKNERLGLMFPDDLAPYRQEFIDAETDQDLYWAITRFSNARRDRHLSVEAVDGGLDITASYNHFDPADYPGVEIDPSAAPVVPLTFLPDFGGEPVGYFVAELADDLSLVEGGDGLSLGDRVTMVNGTAFAAYIDSVRPYHRYSTHENFWMRSALTFGVKTTALPEDMYSESLVLTLLKPTGETYQITAPYVPMETVSFSSRDVAPYPGFSQVIDAVSFDLYRPDGDQNVVILDWYGFREDLADAMDQLMVYAAAENLLDHDIILDASRARGGGRGAYAVQRLRPQPFKTTFGNLRLSDIVPEFIAQRRATYDRQEVMSDGAPETDDDGTWLIEWLEDDVVHGLEAGQDYSNNVPFKNAHAPKWSDGVIQPADVHFSGNMVCWFSPYGGSHLDQFASIMADNDLCHSIGMETGGYSNTWEWTETITLPGTEQPLISFMWSIGHTIRPNGEIQEGNPAPIDDYIPLTAENFSDYPQILMARSFEYLDAN